MNIEKKVIDHFSYASDVYSKRKGFIHEEDPEILNFIKETCTIDSKVLEVGGGSGYILDLIASETGIKHLYNCEVVPEVYVEQAEKDINLIGGSALDLPFKCDSFDYLIIKNLLHHLVSRTRKQSKDNAGKAIKELTRVAKDRAHIIILEQYNRYSTFSSIIFYFSLLFSLLGISLRPFQLRKNVIVSFLTPDEIRLMIPTNFQIKILEINRSKILTRFKFNFLMSNIGRTLFICQKRL